nr:hypothetical protein [Fredinandcohnia onubensis]
MNKILLLVVFACALFLAGCSSEKTGPSQQVDENNTPPKQVEVDEDDQATTKEAEVDEEEETPSKQVGEEKITEPFEIDTATYEDGELIIYYPQLNKMQDKELEQEINTLIKEDATVFLQQYQGGDSPLEMNYEAVFPDSDTFSIRYTGDYNGGMYPTSLFFTTTIDWTNGEKVRLADMFVIDEGFIEKLENAPYIDWQNPKEPNQEKQAAIVEYVKTLDSPTLIEAVTKADHPNPEENPYGVFSYFLEDAVIISIQVPHALGDHAEFELKISDLVKK